MSTSVTVTCGIVVEIPVFVCVCMHVHVHAPLQCLCMCNPELAVCVSVRACVCVSHLAGSGVGADAQWTVCRSRVVHHTHQLLPAHQLLDLPPGGHAVPDPCPPKRLRDEPDVTLHLRVHTLILYPEREGGGRDERQKETIYV